MRPPAPRAAWVGQSSCSTVRQSGSAKNESLQRLLAVVAAVAASLHFFESFEPCIRCLVGGVRSTGYGVPVRPLFSRGHALLSLFDEAAFLLVALLIMQR